MVRRRHTRGEVALQRSSTRGEVAFQREGMPIYQTQWSAKRLRDIANAIEGKKRDVISKSSFGDLLYISPLVPPPEGLLDFIVMRIDPKKCLLKINDRKKIHFTRDMVKKIFNVPSGSRPLEFGKRGKADFRDVYLDGERAPIATIVIYMDHLDIPRGCIVDHNINYSLPRACFVQEMNFTAVVAVDTLDDSFGKRPFSTSTPYATSEFLSYVDQLAQRSIQGHNLIAQLPQVRCGEAFQAPSKHSQLRGGVPCPAEKLID